MIDCLELYTQGFHAGIMGCSELDSPYEAFTEEDMIWCDGLYGVYGMPEELEAFMKE